MTIGDMLTATSASLKYSYVSLFVFVLACSIPAQTYNVGSRAGQKSQTKTEAAPAHNQPLGWGSNIQNARLARAAELALQHGDHALAVEYAERAVQAAPSDSQLWFLLGYTARLDGKSQLSVDSYIKGIRLNPEALEGLSGLAQTYSIMGKTDEAEHLLIQVLSSDPKRREDTLLLGDLYMRSGDYTSAVDWLNKAERMQPGTRSELLLALSYQHLKQMDRAGHYLSLAKTRAPENPEVQRSLAGYYREVGNYPAAVISLNSIRNPNPDVTAELAYTYQLEGNMNESAKLYTKSANAMPNDLGLQLSAAQADVAVGFIDGANAFLQRATKINADSYRLHAILGEIAQIQEDNSDAVLEYNTAIAHLPASPIEGPLYDIQLHVDLTGLYRNLGDESAAQQQIKIAQSEINALHEHGPDRVQFLRLRAQIKMNAGNIDSALSDMKEAIAISTRDLNNLQIYGDLLMKLGNTEDAIVIYKQALAIDPKNRFALTSLGYASRAAGRDHEAEKYFIRLEQANPSLYVPYLALGDMYTAHNQFAKAEISYKEANVLSPGNALVVAGGMNASIEAHRLDITKVWLGRATRKMQQEPQILQEKERYLSFEGEYLQSTQVGQEAIKVLPHDRDVVVYLGYDFLHLEKYSELLKLTSQYYTFFPHDPDVPLLAGYAHKHDGQYEQALQDFTSALDRDPKVVTAYVNRGYVLNDLHKPKAAAEDFESAIRLDPKDGEAHLGLAFANLNLRKPHAAIRQSQLAEKEMGDSKLIHMIRATAYGREGMLTKASGEYRDALKFTPDDGTLYLGLGNTLFSQRRYHEAVDVLLTAQKLSPNDDAVYALLARAYAHLHDREQTLHYVRLAEQHVLVTPFDTDATTADSEMFVATGKALSTLGDQRIAMEQFKKALAVPSSNRVEVRLAIAQLMAQQNHPEDAERQIALALMEAQAGETAPATGDQFIEVADIFRQMHEYQLSQTYLERAKPAGASDIAVRIGMANTYLALGDTARAEAELSAIKKSVDSEPNYQYLLTEANVYRQEHQSTQALTAFAQAADDAGEDQTAEQSLLEAGADEGFRVNHTLSLLSNVLEQPIFEDTTVYVLDSKLDAASPVPPSQLSLLPPPRSSLQTQGTVAYHLHWRYLPTASGFFQINNTQGQISVPATSSIVNRNTNDYSLNFGLNPTVHLGRNVLTFNTGIQGTIRRDFESPVEMNQNLFRAFTYISTSSFFNAISASGYVIWDDGPFTESNLHSRALTGSVDFRVGQPWGRTALVTGWGVNDQKFSPVEIEDYYTTSYVGLMHRFSQRLNAEALVEDLRAWRVVGANSGIAQDLRPTGTIDFAPTRRWDIQASTAYSSTRGFHVYDATQNGFSVSYARPLHRKFKNDTGDVNLQYPIRFAAGFQQETFFNFTYGNNQTFLPYVSITLF